MWHTAGMSGERQLRAVVVGSGLAGLTCARELAAASWSVEVVSPGRAGRDGATHRVHALAPWILLTAPWVRGDSPDRFMRDLAARGQGMAREGLTDVLAGEAHRTARELAADLDLVQLGDEPALLPGDELPRGMRFLPRNKHVLLTPLLRQCAALGVRMRERSLAVGLLRGAGRIGGIVAFDRASGAAEGIEANAVVLACGGSGAVFPISTVPRWCRGSGLALATCAGALLHHPENTQALPVTATPPLFFPTTAVLLSGRILVDGRALPAPESLEAATMEVARALLAGRSVRLDAGEGGAVLPRRAWDRATFRDRGPVPLAVAAHHGVGGVAIDAWGRSSLPGLYACGEAAGGIQGRRRTMGTGLIEAKLFASRTAQAVCRDARRPAPSNAATERHSPPFPRSARALERRLDDLLGPLTALRPVDAVEATWAELAAWPSDAAGPADQDSALAGLRRQAALAMLAPSRPSTGAASGVAARESAG